MASSMMSKLRDKQAQVVLFSSTAIALYGYDQVGCAVGAILFSKFADWKGRKPGIFACFTTASVGNLLMFIAGLKGLPAARSVMILGRVVMGLGVGGIDSVIPVYTAELSEDDARGTALAKEFQANIFGLNMAFILNVILTHQLGKTSQWAWRVPIIVMQIYPIILFSGATLLPESPRWLILKGKTEKAKHSIKRVFGEDAVEPRLKELQDAHKQEEEEGMVSYADMLLPSGSQFHPTVVTVMGQVNQALTGYGAVSVYGPQIFQLLGFGVTDSEYITLGNYIFYFIMMTFAWILIDRKGRRWLLVIGAFWLSISFGLLTILGGLAYESQEGHKFDIPLLATGIPGIVVLYLATSVFGIGWLVPPWLIPTEIYPSSARANGAAVSVIIWGFANFAVTLLTPIGFNNLKYYLFLIFCGTNAFAGWWTYAYCPESGNRSFEENQEFFTSAANEETWYVKNVDGGKFLVLEDEKNDEEEGDAAADGNGTRGKKNEDGEREPLLADRSRSQSR